MIRLLNNLLDKTRQKFGEERGLTLVEVVVAFFIIVIISTIMIRGTITAVNTVKINKSKTEALAVASEKMEILKSFEWDDVLINYGTGGAGNEYWTDTYPELSDDVFDVGYEISWAYGEVGGCKHVKVSVSGDELKVPIQVVTRFFPPAGEEATGGNIYPPPEDLMVQSDYMVGEERHVDLVWIAPDTERTVIRYNIYRNNLQIGTALTEMYPDITPDYGAYSYYVTAYYQGDVESVPSNSVSTGTPFIYPPPQNLFITGYSLSGEDRTVNLAWEPPETELIIVGYIVYREDDIGTVEEVGITAPEILTFENIIGESNYTFYVVALYEDDNISSASNTVTTTS